MKQKSMRIGKEIENTSNEGLGLSRQHEHGGAWHCESAGTLNDAIAIAAIVHKGQFDKAGDPYILHPLRMMMRMADEIEQIVAVLHDVVEDSSSEDKWDSDRLRSTGFCEEVIEAIDCVTKRNGESYERFVERAAANRIARRVKIADLEDNMNILRLDIVNEKRLERIAKYHRSWKRLTSNEKV